MTPTKSKAGRDRRKATAFGSTLKPIGDSEPRPRVLEVGRSLLAKDSLPAEKPQLTEYDKGLVTGIIIGEFVMFLFVMVLL